MSRLFFVLFISFSFVCQSQSNSKTIETTINGTAINAKDTRIRLYSYNNYISMSIEQIANDSIGSDGHFKIVLKMNPREVMPVYFAIERYKSHDFFIEAGKTYNLVLDSMDYSIQDEIYSPLTSAFPVISIRNPEIKDDVNKYISELSYELMLFSVTDYLNVIQTRNRLLMDSVKNKIDSIFDHVELPFFKELIEYSIAEFEYNAKLYNSNFFVKKYLNERPFLYGNIAFMNFFNTLFDKFIYTSRKIKLNDLDLHIVKEPNYKALLDSLGKDTLIKNELVRDMVLIKNLNQMYYENIFPRRSIYDMMVQISEKSKFPKHRKIANILSKEMNLHYKIVEAPKFWARDIDGQKVDLESYKGLYTYVYFFTTYCRVCIPEFAVIEHLIEKYGMSINFVAVSMDISFLKFYYFVKDNRFSCDFMNFAKNFDIEDLWGVKIFPIAFMLDTEGNIINNNAPMPSENLENYIKRLLTPEK